MIDQELEVRYDSRLKNARTGATDNTKLVAKINSISPEAAAYLRTIQDLVKNNATTVEWGEHESTVTPGRHMAVRTNGTTTPVTVNDEGVLKTLNVVDIYVPVNIKADLATSIYCLAPNHVRLIGNFNGVESEAIIVSHSVTIDLINDYIAQTHRIVQRQVAASTGFTARIYETAGNVIVPFTARIYEPDAPTFSARIYNED